MVQSWDEVVPLVEKAQMGDRRAFGELVERFRGSVTAMARKHTRNDDEADDLAQDVFIHAMKKIAQVREPRAFGGWLRQMVARMAINRSSRGRMVFGIEPEMLDTVEGRSTAPLDRLELNENTRELHVGLEQLKRMDRETLEAFYLRGRTLIEMSREFDTPIGTIKRRLFVARNRLRTVMGREDIDESDELPTCGKARKGTRELATAV